MLKHSFTNRLLLHLHHTQMGFKYSPKRCECYRHTRITLHVDEPGADRCPASIHPEYYLRIVLHHACRAGVHCGRWARVVASVSLMAHMGSAVMFTPLRPQGKYHQSYCHSRH